MRTFQNGLLLLCLAVGGYAGAEGGPAAGIAAQPEELNKLLKNELSAVETYQQALKKEPQAPAKDGRFRQLSSILDDHRAAALRLVTQIEHLGGTPVQDSGAWGTWSKMVMGTASQLGDKLALKALKEGEESGLEGYQDVQGLDSMSADAKILIGDLVGKQKSHIQTLEGLIARHEYCTSLGEHYICRP